MELLYIIIMMRREDSLNSSWQEAFQEILDPWRRPETCCLPQTLGCASLTKFHHDLCSGILVLFVTCTVKAAPLFLPSHGSISMRIVCVQNWAATAQANMMNYRSSGVFSGMSSSLLSATDSKSFMADTKQFAAKTKDFMGKSTALFRGKFGGSNRGSSSTTK
jgi:hypothetical protein